MSPCHPNDPYDPYATHATHEPYNPHAPHGPHDPYFPANITTPTNEGFGPTGVGAPIGSSVPLF